MANKYVRHGETFNGNGTTSAIAASDGAPGAFNNLLSTLTQLASYIVDTGDVVYIKTTDHTDADFAITNAVSATFGNSGGATWVWDDGTVWPSKAGQVTFNRTGTSGATTYAALNTFACNNRWSHILTTAGLSFSGGYVVINSIVRDAVFDSTAATKTDSNGVAINSSSTLVGCFLRVNGFSSNGGIIVPSSAKLRLVNCRIELTGVGIANTLIRIVSSTAASIEILGGEIFGAGSLSTTKLLGTSQGSILMSGCKYPRTMVTQGAVAGQGHLIINGADGVMGSFIACRNYELDSRDDGIYPYLNAVLPDSASTPWSYKLYPLAATPTNPGMAAMSKLWTQASAAKTITLNFLSHNDMAIPTSDLCWMDVEYKQTDGTSKSISSYSHLGAAIDTSTAGWNITNYGAENLTKRRIILTTPTSIAQDTVVNITFFFGIASVSANQVLFICPDPVFS